MYDAAGVRVSDGLAQLLKDAQEPPPLVGGWVLCDENADRAEERAREYIGGYYQSVIRHYELIGDHLTKMRGYESYKGMQERMNTPGGADEMIEFFLGLQVYGTPEQCYERVVDTIKRTSGEGFIGVISYAGMPYDAAEENIRLFAKEVMPELKRYVSIEDQLIARAGAGEAANAEGFLLPPS